MLTLTLSVLESNDASSLVFTDTTGSTATTAWGQDGNINVTDIDGSTHTLELSLIHKNADGTITYDTIDLYAEFGPFTTTADLVFTITPDLLLVSGAGNSDDTLADGIYEVAYAVDTSITNMTVFAYSNIRNATYDRLRQIPSIYNSYDSRSKEIDDTLLQYSFIKSMEASAYVALETELINILDAAEKLNVNGCNYTWK